MAHAGRALLLLHVGAGGLPHARAVRHARQGAQPVAHRRLPRARRLEANPRPGLRRPGGARAHQGGRAVWRWLRARRRARVAAPPERAGDQGQGRRCAAARAGPLRDGAGGTAGAWAGEVACAQEGCCEGAHRPGGHCVQGEGGATLQDDGPHAVDRAGWQGLHGPRAQPDDGRAERPCAT